MGPVWVSKTTNKLHWGQFGRYIGISYRILQHIYEICCDIIQYNQYVYIIRIINMNNHSCHQMLREGGWIKMITPKKWDLNILLSTIVIYITSKLTNEIVPICGAVINNSFWFSPNCWPDIKVLLDPVLSCIRDGKHCCLFHPIVII